MVLREAQNLSYFASVSQIWKFKRPIQTVEHDFHIELSLEIKIHRALRRIISSLPTALHNGDYCIEPFILVAG
jgi:hypothetical protein